MSCGRSWLPGGPRGPRIRTIPPIAGSAPTRRCGGSRRWASRRSSSPTARRRGRRAGGRRRPGPRSTPTRRRRRTMGASWRPSRAATPAPTVPTAQAEALPRVRHFEIWNEPNLGGFLSPQVSGGRRVAVTRYVADGRRAGPAITRVNPGAIVIAGAGGPRSSSDARGTGALAWARAIAASSAPFDAFSQHVYPAAAPLAATRAFPAWRTLPSLFAALDAVPRRRGTPVYLTEVGYTTARTPFRTVRVTPAQQAALPAADHGPAGGQVRARARGHLVQPPGQPELAGRPPACRRDASSRATRPSGRLARALAADGRPEGAGAGRAEPRASCSSTSASRRPR